LSQDEVEKLYSQISEQAKAKLQVDCILSYYSLIHVFIVYISAGHS